MRILFVVSAGKDTGIYTSALAIAEKLRENGIHVDIDGHFSLKYDLIHVHNPVPTAFSLSKMMHWNKPIVCTTNMTEDELHGIVPSFLHGLAKTYLWFFYSNCDKIIATSPKIFKNLKAKKEFSEKTVFLTHAINLENFQKNEKLGKTFKKTFKISKPVVLAVASIQKRKGILDFAKIARELKQYQFVWVGKISSIATLEDREKIEKILTDNDSNIVFPGYLDGKELAGAYSAASVFVFPTHAETFGLVAVEAAAFGLPVIARNLPEFENFSQFAVKFNNNLELRKKICHVLESRTEWNRLSKLSLKCSKKFGMGELAEKLSILYGKTIEVHKQNSLPNFQFNEKAFTELPQKLRQIAEKQALLAKKLAKKQAQIAEKLSKFATKL